MSKMSKAEFMEAYHYSKSTYQRRMAILKNTTIFSAAYERVTGQEVRIDTDLYDKFLSYLAYNRLRTKKMKPEEFLKQSA